MRIGARDIPAMRASGFGAPQSVTAALLRADPPTADKALKNAGALRGKVAVVDRGGCTFTEKALRCAQAGAAGVLFVNSEDNMYQPEASRAHGPVEVPIPVLCVGKADGAALADGLVAQLHLAQGPASPGGAAPRKAVMVGGRLADCRKGRLSGAPPPLVLSGHAASLTPY